MSIRRSSLAALLGFALSSGLPNLGPIAAATGSMPPTRSRQRPKGWKKRGGTGQLRASRSKVEQALRLEAAQAKRERRMARNRRLAGFA